MPSASHTIAPVDSSYPATTTRQAALIALGVTALVAALIVLAGLASVMDTKVWILSVILALAAGWFVKPAQRNALVLTLIPATLLTNSAIVPHSGRYVPAITVIGALLIASRAEWPGLVSRIRALPPALLWLLLAYVAWMGVTTLTSTQRGTSATYVFGSAVTLGVAFLVIPSLANRSKLVRQIVATVAITGAVIVLSGLVLALIGSLSIYGGSVGLYFITEATVLGHPTGLVFLQDYGPFVGPETTPLGLGLAGSIYLFATTLSRWRMLWVATGVIVFLGLLSTFSREGWLIVLIVCGALAVFGRRGSPMARPMIAVALVMLVVFAAGITNVIGVNGRLDLTAAWYGPNASSVLLNPNPGNRGEAQTPGSTSSGGGTPSQRSLSQPCVAVEASGTSSGTSVQLKGTSSLFARLCLWEAAARAIAHRPLFGFGPGTGTQAIVPYFNGLGAGLIGATTHDTYLRVGVEMGVPGLLIYLALTGFAVWVAIGCLRARQDRAQNILAASILAISVAELTDTLLFGGLSFPGFWLAMSVGLLAVRPAEQGERVLDRAGAVDLRSSGQTALTGV